jgi:Outer membrane protein beta-barrel domain
MRHLVSSIGSVILLTAVTLVCIPASARADGYVSPFVGVNFENNSGNGRANFGADVGWMSDGIIGLEGEFGYYPSFFGNGGVFGSNYVSDVMGNVIVGVPVGGTSGATSAARRLHIRPFATVGLGLLRSQITGGPSGTVAVDKNDWALNAGAGVMDFLSPHVGIRGEVRYFRDLNGNSTLDDINFGSFHFWRASFGVVLKF